MTHAPLHGARTAIDTPHPQHGPQWIFDPLRTNVAHKPISCFGPSPSAPIVVDIWLKHTLEKPELRDSAGFRTGLAHLVPRESEPLALAQDLLKVLHRWGHQEVVLKCDGEATLRSAQEVKRRREGFCDLGALCSGRQPRKMCCRKGCPAFWETKSVCCAGDYVPDRGCGRRAPILWY